MPHLEKVVPNAQSSHFYRVYERWLVGSITPNFFKGDADSQMQTRGISFCLEDTCHCTKTRPLRKRKKYSIIKIVTPTDFCSNTPRILTNKISQNEHRLRLHSQDPKGKWKERTQIDCITGIELFNHLKV